MTIGEIHWVKLPDSGGREQAGRRPAIVIQNDDRIHDELRISVRILSSCCNGLARGIRIQLDVRIDKISVD
jgi:mRNA-degrading endonuclease toxin of MazEF toxin-antitoxin module